MLKFHFFHYQDKFATGEQLQKNLYLTLGFGNKNILLTCILTVCNYIDFYIGHYIDFYTVHLQDSFVGAIDFFRKFVKLFVKIFWRWCLQSIYLVWLMTYHFRCLCFPRNDSLIQWRLIVF